MSFFKRTLDVSRFRISGEFPDGPGWKEEVRNKLTDFSFVDPVGSRLLETIEGWVKGDDLSSSDFTDQETWLIQDYLFFGLRIDKRRLPRNLFNAELKRRVAAWTTERGIERAPASVRKEIKEDLENQWCMRVLPTVKHVQIVVDIGRHPRVVGNEIPSGPQVRLFGRTGETETDSIRRRFFRTFGLRLIPVMADPSLEYGADLMEKIHGMGMPLVLRNRITEDEG